MQVKAERAKIFAPFSPLRGMNSAYREKERVIIPRPELLEDRINEIDVKLNQISLGDFVRVIYYSDGEYKKVTGMIRGFSKQKCFFTVTKPINFNDIYDIELL